ncbi:MAG: helicase C-terminal domain-containing protein [Ardenticatenales bacterium]
MPTPPTYVSLDLETTGLSADRDAIIEVGAVKFTLGNVLGEFSSLVQPGVKLSHRIEQLTGIRTIDLVDAPPIAPVLAELAAFVGDAHVVGHNVGFDLAFLKRAGWTPRGEALDTHELATILVPEARYFSLGNVSRFLALDADPNHRALPDARTGRVLFEALVERARRLPPATLTAIERLSGRVAWPAGHVFRFAADEPLPSDLPRGAAPGPLGAALRASPRPVEIDAEAVGALLGPHGALASAMAGYEDRPGQQAMLHEVARALNEGDQVLIEAGTGTGKSLAYLLPAAAYAIANGCPVVVSTHTLTLQDQLVGKDLPLVRTLLDGGLRFALLKGRDNYLCRSRLDVLTARDDLDLDQTRTLAKLLVWAPNTATGDRVELALRPEDERTWRLACAAGENCTSDRCAYAGRGECWINRARMRAFAAHIIVVNHALLASDMISAGAGHGILPPYKHLVIDESHHLEDVATDVLSFQAGRTQLMDAVAALTAKSRGALAARLTTALEMLRMALDTRQAASALLDQLARLSGGRADAEHGIAEVFNALNEFLRLTEGHRMVERRLTEAERHSPDWSAVELAWDDARTALAAVLDAGRRLLSGLVAIESDLTAGDPLVADLRAALGALEALVEGLDRAIASPQGDDVVWVAADGQGRQSLHVAPLDVGPTLARHLFADKETLILTSATLRAPDFDFARERLHLPDAADLIVESPFDFERQALLLVPGDMPEPNRPEYQRALDRALIALGTAVRGRMLVLYTSHAGLRESYHAIRGPLGEVGITVIGQGMDGSRNTLLATFKDPDTPTVLLGTRSFWEGIDIPGEALSCLVITRIPFDVPTDPLFAARSERLDDAFNQLSIPHALLRFRQGFGRLIRTRADRGIVALLDGRLTGKRYGATFLDALPDCTRRRAVVADLGHMARDWMDAGANASFDFDAAFAPKMARNGPSRVEYPGPADAGPSHDGTAGTQFTDERMDGR